MGRGSVTFELSSDMVGCCAHGSGGGGGGGGGVGVHMAHEGGGGGRRSQ